MQNVLPTKYSLRTAALSLSSARSSILFWSPFLLVCKARSSNTLRTPRYCQPSWIFMTKIWHLFDWQVFSQWITSVRLRTQHTKNTNRWLQALPSPNPTPSAVTQANYKWKQHFTNKVHVPWQNVEFPVYPWVQTHWYDPRLLMHVALDGEPQTPPLSHSSISTIHFKIVILYHWDCRNHMHVGVDVKPRTTELILRCW